MMDKQCRDCFIPLTEANRAKRKLLCKSCFNTRHRAYYFVKLGRGPLPRGGENHVNPLRDEIIRLFEVARLGQARIAQELEISRNAVAGIIYRNCERSLRHIAPTPPLFDPFPKSANGCRYIAGDPKAASSCCGEPVLHYGEAWCATHRKIVYLPRRGTA